MEGSPPTVSPDFRWGRGIVRASLPRRERIQQPLRRRALIAVDPPPDLLAERRPSGPQPRRDFNAADKLTCYLYSRESMWRSTLCRVVIAKSCTCPSELFRFRSPSPKTSQVARSLYVPSQELKAVRHSPQQLDVEKCDDL